MNNKSKKLVNNTFLFFIGNIGSKFIQFLLVPLYTFALTPADFGTVDIVLTFVNFLIPIFSVQMSDGLLRFGLDKNEDKYKIINSVFVILFIGSLISVLCSPFFALFNSLNNWILFFILILNLRIYRDIFSIVLKVEDKNKVFVLDSIFYTLTLCLSSILFLVVFKLGINGYFISYIISNLFSIIFILIFSKFNFSMIFSKPDMTSIKRIFIYSFPLIFNSIGYWIITASDRFMINSFIDEHSVGLYAVAAKIPAIIVAFTSVFTQAWLISSISESNNDDKNEFYSNTFKYYCIFSFLFSIGIITFIKPFMFIYVEKQFFSSWLTSSILIFSCIFSGFNSFHNSIYYALKKNISVTFTTIFGAILNIILNLIFIKYYGIVGAAIATLISWIILFFIKSFYLKFNISFRFEFLRVIFYSLIITLQIIFLTHFNSYLSLLLNLILFMICCFIERKIIFNLFKLIFRNFRR